MHLFNFPINFIGTHLELNDVTTQILRHSLTNLDSLTFISMVGEPAKDWLAYHNFQGTNHIGNLSGRRALVRNSDNVLYLFNLYDLHHPATVCAPFDPV
jgi:hypothetical protein